MANQNFITTLAAFTPDSYYEGPNGFMPGGGAFLASALFMVVADVNADQYIVQNRDVGNNRGWAILARPAAAGMTLLAQVGDGTGMNETSLAVVPHGVFALVHIAAQPNAVDLFVQGTNVTTLAITGSASTLAPQVGVDQGGADPAGGTQIAGIGYTPNAPQFQEALATLHYLNCRNSFDMAQFIQAPPETPGADFTNRWTARTGAVAPLQAGADPATAVVGTDPWRPIAGSQGLTRVDDGNVFPVTTTATNPPWLALEL